MNSGVAVLVVVRAVFLTSGGAECMKRQQRAGRRLADLVRTYQASLEVDVAGRLGNRGARMHHLALGGGPLLGAMLSLTSLGRCSYGGTSS